MKTINPEIPVEETPAQAIVRILANMAAKEALRLEIEWTRKLVEAGEASAEPVEPTQDAGRKARKAGRRRREPAETDSGRKLPNSD